MVFIDLDVTGALHKFSWRHSEGPVVLRVCDEIDNATADDCLLAIGQCKSNGQTMLPIIIDSPGGCVYSLLNMLDALENSGLEVVTCCVGKAFSAASVLLAAGTRRFMAPSATLMVHQVSSFSGWLKSSDLAVESNESQKLNRALLSRLSGFCGKESSYWNKIIKRNNSDLYMSADVAKSHGVCDYIAVPTMKVAIQMSCGLSFTEVKSLRHVDTLADFEKEGDVETEEAPKAKAKKPKKKSPPPPPSESDDEWEDEEEDEPEEPKRKKRKASK